MNVNRNLDELRRALETLTDGDVVQLADKELERLERLIHVTTQHSSANMAIGVAFGEMLRFGELCSRRLAIILEEHLKRAEGTDGQ